MHRRMMEESIGRYRFARTVLAVSTTLMGACGIIYEYTLGALGSNLMGSTHEQLFVIIGIMLFAMGIGSLGQRVIKNNLIDMFLIVEICLGLVGGTSALIIYISFVHTSVYAVVLYGFASLIGLMIGLEIPLLIRIGSEYSSSLRAALSDILCMDYIGALAGALVFTYVLLTAFSVEKIAVLLGVINTAIGLVGLVYFWPLVKNRWAMLAITIGIFGVLGTVFVRSEDWMATLEQRCYRDPVILSETSKYQHIVLTKRNERINLYINGHLQFSSTDEAIYHELLTHVPMAAAKTRKRVLILGGGDGLALREVLRYRDVHDVALVDLDPVITDLAAENPELVKLNRAAFHDARVMKISPEGVEPGERLTVRRPAHLPQELIPETFYDLAEVRIFNIDADLFIRDMKGPFDVVIIDFPDPGSLELAKLYSVEFYRTLAEVLSPDAVVSVQSTSPFHAKEVYRCIGETLRAAGYNVLPYHDNVPSFGEWGWHLAWRGGASPSEQKKKLKEMTSLDVHTNYLTAELMAAAFVFGQGWLKGDDIQANTKMRPMILQYYRTAWKRENG